MGGVRVRGRLLRDFRGGRGLCGMQGLGLLRGGGGRVLVHEGCGGRGATADVDF